MQDYERDWETTKSILKTAFIVAWCAGIYWFGHQRSDRDWEAEMVNRGYAHYCRNSGEWAWKGECDEE